jgi:hypothetical protein
MEADPPVLRLHMRDSHTDAFDEALSDEDLVALHLDAHRLDFGSGSAQ